MFETAINCKNKESSYMHFIVYIMNNSNDKKALYNIHA